MLVFYHCRSHTPIVIVVVIVLVVVVVVVMIVVVSDGPPRIAALRDGSKTSGKKNKETHKPISRMIYL